MDSHKFDVEIKKYAFIRRKPLQREVNKNKVDVSRPRLDLWKPCLKVKTRPRLSPQMLKCRQDFKKRITNCRRWMPTLQVLDDLLYLIPLEEG